MTILPPWRVVEKSGGQAEGGQNQEILQEGSVDYFLELSNLSN